MPATLSSLSPMSPSVPHPTPLSGTTPGVRCEPAGRGDPVAPAPTSDPILPPRPIAMTPPPLLLLPSTPTATIELSAPMDPRTIGSTWVRHRQDIFMNFGAIPCSPALHPYSSILAPPSQKLHLSPQSFQLHFSSTGLSDH